MRPLQDRCYPTPREDLEELLLTDLGKTVDDLFDDFDPKPLGVASLAQVHSARLKGSGQHVAVKLQHPHLSEFCDVDMKTVEISLRLYSLAHGNAYADRHATFFQGGSSDGSQNLNLLGWEKRCEKIFRKRWILDKKPSMQSGQLTNLKMSLHPCIFRKSCLRPSVFLLWNSLKVEE